MSPKFVLVLGILSALSLVVLADTSKENQTETAATTAEAADEPNTMEPQMPNQRRCPPRCCLCIRGRCIRWCKGTMEKNGEGKMETLELNTVELQMVTDEPNTVEPQIEIDEPNTMEPQMPNQRRCPPRCCLCIRGRCIRWCKGTMENNEEGKMETVEPNTVEPQMPIQRRCRHGCCLFRHSHCIRCCKGTMEENDEAI